MSRRPHYWHRIAFLGAMLLTHGVAICTAVALAYAHSAAAPASPGGLLLSAAVFTVGASIWFRKWLVARIFLWMGGLRLIAATAIIPALDLGPIDYRHLLVMIMALLSILEFYAASKLRRVEHYCEPLRWSACVGILLSAILLLQLPAASRFVLESASGIAMTVSGGAIIALALAYRRMHKAADSAMQLIAKSSSDLVPANGHLYEGGPQATTADAVPGRGAAHAPEHQWQSR